MISLYQRCGPGALATPGLGGRRHHYWPMAEEQRFIEPFLPRAATGAMATMSSIKEAFEAPVHQTVHKTPSYRRLARHGWRQMAPRANHPEATPAIQAAFQKPLRQLSKPPFSPAHPLIRARSS
jgi:Winged helix-turn helix